MKIKFIMTLISLLFLSQLVNAQSPWTKKKGKAYFQFGYSGIYYNKAQIDGKTIDLNANYSDVTLQSYNEYGITNKLEVLTVFPYKLLAARNENPTVSSRLSGLGNITIGIKYKLIDNKWKMATGLQYTMKTGKQDNESGLSTGFNANILLPYLTLGSSKGKWYYFGYLGYGYMSNNYSDYLKIGIEFGYNITPKGFLIFDFDTRNIILKEAAFNTDKEQSIAYSDRQTYNTIGLKFNYEFKKDKFGVNASVFGSFGNDNVALAPAFNSGIYFKL